MPAAPDPAAPAAAAAPDLAYRVAPVPTSQSPGPWPGVVLVHDAFGPSDDMREQADWLAAAGYVVAMPDLYHGRSMVRCVRATAAQLARQQGPAFAQVDAARSQLAGSDDCTGTVGVIGYCLGGGFALLLAARPGWSASAVNYGPLPDDLDEVLGGACPIVASYGARDRSLRRAAERLRKAADRTGTVLDVREYPDAGHAFINRQAVASPLTAVMRVAGVGYHHGSAADAKRRILAFFDEHLRAPSGEPG